MNLREQHIRIPMPQTPRLLPPTRLRYEPTSALWGHPSLEARVELARRMTLPFATAALLLLGIALGISHPRFHKGGALIRSLGIILLYFVGLKLVEDQFQAGRLVGVFWLYILPGVFGLIALGLLASRLRPHHENRFRIALGRHAMHLLEAPALRRVWVSFRLAMRSCRSALRVKRKQRRQTLLLRKQVFARWSSMTWFQNWIGAMAIFTTLYLLIQFATMAGELSKNQVGAGLFVRFWLWSLPGFMSLVLPLAFLFAAVLTFSDASVSHEWVAIRAGGVSLVQWLRASAPAWGMVLVLTAATQILVSPTASQREDILYAQIYKRPPEQEKRVRPWLYLGGTQILWHLEGAERWGFPLRAPGEAPILLHWRVGDPRAKALPWGGIQFVDGPESDRLFPSETLRNFQKPEHIPTWDLIQWQRWAPEPGRATLLWTRLLGWLSGPCLLLAALGNAFPAPRKGRGQVLGTCLILGILFIGLQMIFSNAGRSGELPAFWAVLAPVLICFGYGMTRLPRLRT